MTTGAGCPLLTIAVPTYNRARFLDSCLDGLFGQVHSEDPRLEILVSDNDSLDDTAQVVQKHARLGHVLKYVKNERNVGPDRNFLQCFLMARGRYVLLLGDDDLLLEGAVGRLLEFLATGDYGLVHLNSYGFVDDFRRERPRSNPSGRIVYRDIREYVRRVSYFVTFASANVVNKSLVRQDQDWTPFLESNLVQLAWIFEAMFGAERNGYIADYSVAAKMYNSGGYKLGNVFGKNFNRICDRFVARGVKKSCFESMKRDLVSRHFPAQIARQRNHVTRLEPEDYFPVLLPLYRNYLPFWLFTVPAILLPKELAYALYLLARKLRAR